MGAWQVCSDQRREQETARGAPHRRRGLGRFAAISAGVRGWRLRLARDTTDDDFAPSFAKRVQQAGVTWIPTEGLVSCALIGMVATPFNAGPASGITST